MGLPHDSVRIQEVDKRINYDLVRRIERDRILKYKYRFQDCGLKKNTYVHGSCLKIVFKN